ncbi:MAG: ferrous iron transport protein A [candidate division Zixibacteria bacterium]|nr:ferrous iron transport protein A [candidate division Zixibacteria bacterium]
MTYLNMMVPGQKGRVVGFSDDTKLVRRLYELGIQPGRSIVYLRNAPFSDPLEVRVGSNLITLRKTEASLVAVELDE